MQTGQSHYDALEARDPGERERDLFARLPAAIAHAMTAPGWSRQLAGIDPQAVRSRAALAGLPVLRKSELSGLQKATPPFGGFNVTPPGKAKRLHMSPGPISVPVRRRPARAFSAPLSSKRFTSDCRERGAVGARRSRGTGAS